MRVINGLITLICFPLLFNLYRKTNRRFFFFWSLGFLLYGVNILLRGLATETLDSNLALFLFSVSTIGFILIVVGIGELINMTRVILSGTLIVPAILFFYDLLGGDWRDFRWFIVLSPYIFIVLSLYFIMLVHNYNLKILLAGWSSILILNVLNMVNTREILPSGMFDLLSAVSTGIIYWGMTKPNFVLIVDDLNSFMLSGSTTEYHELAEGQFTLIKRQNTSKDKEITWIKNRIDSNSRKGIKTIIVSYYDLLTPNDFSLNEDSEEVYFVRVQLGSQRDPTVLETKVMTINDDINQLDLLLSDIVKVSNENQVSFELILYSLSTIIHTHGWKRVYSFMIALIPLIKSSKVNLTAFFYPESHERYSDISKFEIMADDVIQL